MTIAIGDRIPTVSLRIKTENGIEEILTPDIFDGKTVALFAVTGAFAPTSSTQHLPGFIKNASAIKAKGVDTIACLSVNDPFVMEAWSKENNVGNEILMLADGNSEFTASADLGLDETDFGLGFRSQCYSMLVVDGIVKRINIEEPGQFNKSSAEVLLAQL